MLEKNLNEIHKLVEEAENKVVIDFLVNILVNDEKLLNRFKNIVCEKISSEDIKRYERQIDKIFYKYGDDFIDYNSSKELSLEISEFINDIEVIMINKHEYKASFELSAYLYIKLGRVTIENDDEMFALINVCKEVFERILNESKDKNLEKEVYNWIIDNLCGKIGYFRGEALKEILFDYFHEEEYLKEKLIFIDNKAKECLKSKDSWSQHYDLGYLTKWYITILKELKADEKVIENYCKKYWKVSKVRQICIEENINNKNYDKAIDILIESKKRDKGYPGLVHEYSEKLKELYKKIGDNAKYKNELWDLMLNYDETNIKIFKELKDLYSKEEWINEREKVFKNLKKHHYNIENFYLEEKMFEELFKCVIKSKYLDKVHRYEEDLKPMYEEQLLHKYEEEVKKMASSASSRSYYREIANELTRMKEYEGGEELVKKILEDWRVKYKNRRAMMDELKQL